MGPEGGRPGRPTQAVRHTKQNAFKFKIAQHEQKSIAKIFFWQEDGPPGQRALCLSTPKHNGKSGTDYKLLFTVSV